MQGRSGGETEEETQGGRPLPSLLGKTFVKAKNIDFSKDRESRIQTFAPPYNAGMNFA